MPTVAHTSRDRPCMYLCEKIEERECATCRGNVRMKVFACHHPRHQETTIRGCARCPDYEKELEQGEIRTWAVGVTTAPREIPTIGTCLASLEETGWGELRLFAEPGSEIPASHPHFPVTWRESVIGAWPNWYLGLAELYLREPRADAYMMVQDDTVFCRGVREYVEQVLWPSRKLGFVSVYCPTPYGRGSRGFQPVKNSGGVFGALTCIFPNASVRALLADDRIVAHRLRQKTAGLRNIDQLLGFWAKWRDLPVFYHRPSLAQHIGDTSTIWHGVENRGIRHSDSFVGELAFASSIMGEK